MSNVVVTKYLGKKNFETTVYNNATFSVNAEAGVLSIIDHDGYIIALYSPTGWDRVAYKGDDA